MKNPFQNYKPKKGKPAPHERAHWCKEAADIIKRPFIQVIGMTRDWKLEWIKWSVLEAKKAINPARYWWWFRKKTIDKKKDND